MSDHAFGHLRNEWLGAERMSLIAGGAGMLVCLIGAFVNHVQLFQSYLVAYLFWLGLALGSLALLMLQYLTGGAWGTVIRRVLESGTRTLPLLALLFLPLVGGIKSLYVWSDPAVVATDHALQEKQLYLNIPFFLGRAALYFALWLGAMFLLNRWSIAHDNDPTPEPPRHFLHLSAPGLGMYGLTMTFAAIDWVMSLEPHWFSTIYGLLFVIGQVLSAFAMAIVVVTALAPYPPLSRVLGAGLFRDLGSLLLAFVMLWAYVQLSQFLLIWSGNLPEETPWYIRRLSGGWQSVGVFLLVVHFALPFLLLLSGTVKRNPCTLQAVAIVILFMRVVDLFWLVAPAFSHGSAPELRFHWLDPAALVGIGGLWCWAFLWQLRSRPLLPPVAPDFAAEVHHA